MAVSAQRVTVTNSPTLLTSTPADGYTGTRRVQFHLPIGGAAVDLGGDDVSAGAGFEMLADEFVSVWVQPGEEIYGITASTQVIHVLENGV
jgi:hypothetical protein